LLDLNELGKVQKFIRVGALEVSLDNQKLANTVDISGFREYTLYVKDLPTGALAPESIAHVTAVTWAADDQTLFCTTEDDAKRSYRLYRHRLGTKVADDALLYEEKDARFELDVVRMRGDRYLKLGSSSHTTSEMRLLDAAQPNGEFRVVLPRKQDVEYDIDQRAESLFVLCCASAAQGYHVCVASNSQPAARRPSRCRNKTT
jgi:oligopeptidase B